MKKSVLALALMIACTSGVSAETLRQKDEPPQEWAEKLFGPAANLVHDFGTVPRGTQLRHDFVMTNTYAVPIEITNIRRSMGAPLTYSTNRRVLRPNEKAVISVLMDATMFTGAKRANLYVTVGPAHISTAALAVQAVSRGDICCNPGEVTFGSVIAGQTPTATAHIEYAGKLAWRISDVIIPTQAPFEAKFQEQYRQPGEVGYQVQVSLKRDAPPGHFQETIFLKTNDPEAKLIAMPVRGTIVSPRR